VICSLYLRLHFFQSEKQQLLKKVSDLEVVIEQGSVNTIAAAENEKKLTEELKQTLAKFAQSEKNNEMLLAKAKGQDKKIEELGAKIKQLEDAKKVSSLQTCVFFCEITLILSGTFEPVNSLLLFFFI
jgi:hypothetical protein